MSYSLTLPLLNNYTRYFNALAKAGIDFEIQVRQIYDASISNYTTTLSPLIKNVGSFDKLAQTWEAGCSAVKVSQISDFKGFKEIYSKPSAVAVVAELYKKSNPSVKFYAQTVFDKIPHLGTFLITEVPTERQVENHTYRFCCTPGDYYSSQLVFCANELNPYYNYIDKGHVIVTSSSPDKPESFMFVTDVITLDMNYVLAAFAVYPEAVMSIIPNKAFLPSKDIRVQLIKIEKNIPPRFQADYQKHKAAIAADFADNTQNVMIGKLQRNEVPHIDLNDIRISLTRAVYAAGNVSIEAKNLAEVIFASLNPNEEWDIFTLVNIYTDWVENQFKSLPLNAEGTGFKEKKTFRFKINDIPLKIECFTENTRRAVNDHLINVEELSKVMRRAACYLPEEGVNHVNDFNNFVREVSRISLKVRDILSNGLPVKTMFLESDINDNGKDATVKHPKLRFTRKEKGGFHIVIKQLDKKGEVTATNERRIGKFVEFIKKVENINRKVRFHGNSYYGNGEWTRTHEGGWERKDGAPNQCASQICDLLKDYAEGITDDDKKTLIGTVNKELSEAEKRSEELLKEACKAVGATKAEKNGKPGYVVPGRLRTYFVEEDALRVYDHNTNAYICVVNGRGDQGVGKDSLVARLYALHNDTMITKQVGTLRR